MDNEKVDKAEERVVGVGNTLPATSANDTTALMPSTNDFQYIEKLAEQMGNLEKIGTMLVKGSICGAKTVPDFMVATITGQQLGVPMMTAVNNIFNVNGKAGLSTHLMRALVIKAGVTFEKVADYEPMYVYYDGEADPERPGKLRAVKIQGKDGAGNPIMIATPRGNTTLADFDDTKYVLGRSVVDRITKYIFERKVVQADGTYKTMRVTSYFSYNDAVIADLTDGVNYKKYPSRMLDARSFAIGAREIASDVLFGMYTVAELADANGVKYKMSEDFTEAFEDVEVEEVN